MNCRSNEVGDTPAHFKTQSPKTVARILALLRECNCDFTIADKNGHMAIHIV